MAVVWIPVLMTAGDWGVWASAGTNHKAMAAPAVDYGAVEETSSMYLQAATAGAHYGAMGHWRVHWQQGFPRGGGWFCGGNCGVVPN